VHFPSPLLRNEIVTSPNTSEEEALPQQNKSESMPGELKELVEFGLLPD
jgi:hypothetical protein